MPIFEYTCRKCGETFERFSQRATAIKPPVCPACGSKDAERILSVFAGRVEGGTSKRGSIRDAALQEVCQAATSCRTGGPEI